MKETELLKYAGSHLIYEEDFNKDNIEDGYLSVLKAGFGFPYFIVTNESVNEGTDLQPIVDTVIDTLSKSNSTLIYTQEQIDNMGDDFYEDNYLVGGNEGLYLHTSGVLDFEYLGQIRDINVSFVYTF